MKTTKNLCCLVLCAAACLTFVSPAKASQREFHRDIVYGNDWYWLHANVHNLPQSYVTMRVWPTSPAARRELASMMRKKNAEKKATARYAGFVAAKKASSLAQYHGW